MALRKCRECGKSVAHDARMCPHCGKPHPSKRGGSGVFIIVLFLVACGTCFNAVRNPPSPTSHLRADVDSGQSAIWLSLRREYPELRGDKLYWRTLDGKLSVAVPDPFWSRLSVADKKRLVTELDSEFGTQHWNIITGRYRGNGKIMLDRTHSRKQLLGI